MCGLIGAVNPVRLNIDMDRGLEMIKRRGPDSQDRWRSADGVVTLSHARLKIVDFDSRANQPLHDERAKVAIVMVGEIYNYKDLRSKFSSYPFVSESDTEVALAAYVLHGTRGFDMLKGMFTLAIVDERFKQVFLLRDAIGKKPLYLGKWDGLVVFGSSVLSIAHASGLNVNINDELGENYWKEGVPDATDSLIEGIRPVYPGEVVAIGWDGRCLSQGRSLPDPKVIYDGESNTIVRETISYLLNTAVKRRLSNNPNPVTLLSGGLDSTLVTQLSMDVVGSSSELKTLTLGAIVPGMHDEKYARYAANKLGLDLTVLRLSYRDLFPKISLALDAQDQPLGVPSFFLLYQLVAAASRYGRILLTGDGGDEVFLGYGKPSDWYAGSDLGEKNTVKDTVISGPCLPDYLSPWGIKAITQDLIAHGFEKTDRASAEQGVELRSPLLDWDLVCYVRSLPLDNIFPEDKPKALIREQLAVMGWPERFLDRPKAGFTYNLRWIWLASNYEGLRESVLDSAVERFESHLPVKLRKAGKYWSALDVLSNFSDVWKLLCWSFFERKLYSREVVAG